MGSQAAKILQWIQVEPGKSNESVDQVGSIICLPFELFYTFFKYYEYDPGKIQPEDLCKRLFVG